MPGTFLNFPFDEELFLMQWQAAQDPVITALLNSGALVEDATIRSMIRNGSNLYTIPFYNVLGGEEDNYDGQTDITETEHSGASQSGVVYGRAHSWMDRDFVHDFNSGADPMRSIVAQTSHFWAKKKQARMVKILTAIFGITGNDGWTQHTTNIASKAATAGEANMMGAAAAADAMQKANGDNSGVYSMAVMHSKVAANLAKQNLLEYRKYTDPMGIERKVNIADWNGLTVIVDDGVPVADSSSATGEKDYTTYLFGRGALLGASAPVKNPVETGRETKKYGGYDYLINRLRETIHPNGFSWTMDMASTASPTDTHLGTTGNWKLVADPKLIPMARLITNG